MTQTLYAHTNKRKKTQNIKDHLEKTNNEKVFFNAKSNSVNYQFTRNRKARKTC
jgi:hypothetical protein